jgi:MFS family permease
MENRKLCRPITNNSTSTISNLTANDLSKNCEAHGEDALEGLMLIFFAFFIAGFGISVVQPLGLSYYDDNVDPTQAPLFHGILSTARVIGPFLGYILGSLCLRLYVNPMRPPAGVELKDPRWIGAWWLGERFSNELNSY